MARGVVKESVEEAEVDPLDVILVSIKWDEREERSKEKRERKRE